MADDSLTVEEFLGTVKCEGLGYRLTGYYGPKHLRTLPEGDLRDKVVGAAEALQEAEALVDDLLARRED